MIGRKSPTFVDFRPPDTENFGQGLQPAHRVSSNTGFGLDDSSLFSYALFHGGEMHGLPLLHGRLSGFAKAAGMLSLFEKSRYLC